MKPLELDVAREKLSKLAGEGTLLAAELSRCQQALRETKSRLFGIEADEVLGRASPQDLRGAQEAVASAELVVEEVATRFDENARQDALLRTGIAKLEEDARATACASFLKRHKSAVRELCAAFAGFLSANDAARALEQEGARLGLASTPIFSWADFKKPSYAASLERVALWLKKTEDYIK